MNAQPQRSDLASGLTGAVAIIVPARFASSRYPGKPLVPLRGATGVTKTLVQRSWEAARAADGIDHVLIATDDRRISDAARAFGADVAMTPGGCANGTERCAAAVGALPPEVDIIVNLQGDAPLTPARFIDALIRELRADPGAEIATPAVRCSLSLYDRLLADQQAGRAGGTTVVFDARHRALYFSKRIIPHAPADIARDGELPVFFHLGVYAYRRAALEAYPKLPQAPAERMEGLEQLRFLHAGWPISIVEVDPAGTDLWELNNPADVEPIESALAALGFE